MLDKNQLYEDFHMKVLRYVQSQVNDYYLAEDICSDVFVKVYEKLDSFDDKKASVSTWIFTITRNTLIDYYRRRKVTVEIPDNLVYQDNSDDDINEESLEQLATALNSLDERSKKIVVMYHYDNIKLKDIAEKLGISYTYTKILYKKALILMKKYFN